MNQSPADMLLDADQIDSRYQLGISFLVQGQTDEAIACLQQVVRARPGMTEAHINLGGALQLQGRLKEAVASFEQAIRNRPDVAVTYYNMGMALRDLGEWERGLACLNQALRLEPNYGLAHLARAYAWLQAGDFARGWAEFEWRWACPVYIPPPLYPPRPAWDGSPLKGRIILLRAEQGLGDMLQFARYIPLLHELGAQVIVETYPSLVPLMETCPQVGAVRAVGECPAQFDIYAYMVSVPRLLGTTLGTIPGQVPYLWADPSLIARWGEAFRDISGFKIGIAWKGNPANPRDLPRSARLADFAPLAAVEGVRLFSLQVGAGCEQLATLEGRFAVTDLGSRFNPDSFADAAAVVMNLDLIVTVDTAIAHLAGAMGRPVWLALPVNPDWRWLLGRDDSPWYPTMRLFRQSEPGNYSTVFANMAAELASHLAARST
jgi:hypothetical protein